MVEAAQILVDLSRDTTLDFEYDGRVEGEEWPPPVEPLNPEDYRRNRYGI